MMLSIIIPTLNEEDYLPRFLNEIKKQSFSNYEIIVADANSTDRTVEMAKQAGCRVVEGGIPAKGRNEGAKAAKGDILLFMDADNFYLPDNFFEKILTEFKERDLDAAYFTLYLDGNIVDKIVFWGYNLWTKITQKFLPHASNSTLVKKSIHQKVGGFDETIMLAEDHVYVREIGKCGKFGYIELEDPVLTSARRMERDGSVKTYAKYLLAGIYMLVVGPIRTDIFKYRYYNQKMNSKLKKVKEFIKNNNHFRMHD